MKTRLYESIGLVFGEGHHMIPKYTGTVSPLPEKGNKGSHGTVPRFCVEMSFRGKQEQEFGKV
jgi:hypothetical protein